MTSRNDFIHWLTDETPIGVPARNLHNLFDVLGEQAGNAREWREALAQPESPPPLNEHEARERLAEFCLWLFELEGDLDDWRRVLAEPLGRTDELPRYEPSASHHDTVQ